MSPTTGLNVFENGEKVQTGEFVLTTEKLAVTIHTRNLLKCDTVIDTKPNTASYTITPKVLSAAQRDIQIPRERGIFATV